MKQIILIVFIAFVTNIKAQIITTIAGNGTGAYAGDGGQATAAELATPSDVALDASGNIYIADPGNNRIRKVTTSGIISTIAGIGTNAYSGDGGPATAAELNRAGSVALDGAGNLYIADGNNNVIRKVNTLGIITTVAGNGTIGYSGDGGQATAAQISGPNGVSCDVSGNFYIAENGNSTIRKINTAGIITTVAGNGIGGYSGDGGQATAAELYSPNRVIFDGLRNMYICDGSNNRIRKVNTAGIITTIAGNGMQGFSGDSAQATSAELNNPFGVALDAFGNLYISDGSNNRIRKVNTIGIITTIAGNGTGGFSGDNGQDIAAEVSYPGGLTIDNANNLYFADVFNMRIRKITNVDNFCFPAVPTICMVTTDAASAYNYNIVYWDKTPYNNVDSFIVYRSVSSNYMRIGAVSKNALSEFMDTAFSIGGPNGGNPQYGSWQYKLAIRDTCGNIGAMSPYHQTMFVQENNANFSWNLYTIESGQTNPVTGYSFLRDDNNTGSFHVLANLSNVSISTTDPNYGSYPNGNWRIDATGFNCTPTLRLANGNNNTQNTYVSSHSNTTKQAVMGISQISGLNSQISIYPNPNNGSFVIEPQNTLYNVHCTVYDVNGKMVLSQPINGKTTIDASPLNEGVYNISIISNEGVVNKRLVIVR